VFLLLEHSSDLRFPHPSALLGLYFHWLASSVYPATDFFSLFPENEHDENSNHSRKRMARCLENSFLIFTDRFPGDGLAWAASFTSSKAIQDVKMHLAHFGHDLLDRLESSCTKIPYSESRFESWTPLYSCLWVTEKIGIELEFCRKGFLQNLHKELTNLGV